MKTVIIAAGTGSRLWPHTDQAPKTLLPFGQGTILSQIMSNFTTIGVTEFVIVVGFGAKQIVEYIATTGLGPRVTFVENRDWQRGNGLSVHLVRGSLAWELPAFHVGPSGRPAGLGTPHGRPERPESLARRSTGGRRLRPSRCHQGDDGGDAHHRHREGASGLQCHRLRGVPAG